MNALKTPISAALVMATVMVVVAATMFPPVSAVSDARNYTNMAARLAQTGEYRYFSEERNGGVPDARVPPLYPMFLASFFLGSDAATDVSELLLQRYWLIAAAQGALIVAGIGLTVASAGRVAGDALAWLVAVGCVAYLPFGWLAPVMLSESLALFVVALTLYLGLRLMPSEDSAARPTWTAHAWFGASVALLAMVKPVLVPWAVIPYALMVATRRERLGQAARLAAISLAVFAVVMSPWWIRNVVTLGEWVTTSTGFSTPLLDGTPGRMTLTPAEQALRDQTVAAGGDGDRTVAVSRIKWWVRNDPAGYAAYKLDNVSGALNYQFVGALMPYSWIKEHGALRDSEITLGSNEALQPVWYRRIAPFTALYHRLLWPVAALSTFVVWRRREYWLPWSLVVLTVASYTAVIAMPRYFIPVMPVVILLAGITVFELGRYVQKRWRSRGATRTA